MPLGKRTRMQLCLSRSLGVTGCGCGEVVGRGDDHAADLLTDTHSDHVALDALAGAHSRIEPAGDNVGQRRVDRDL